MELPLTRRHAPGTVDTVAFNGTHFAGPPPTLLPFVATGWMSSDAVASIWVIGSLRCRVAGVEKAGAADLVACSPARRRRHLGGNPNFAVLALLVAGVGGPAILLKVYAAVPLILERRSVAGVGLGVTRHPVDSPARPVASLPRRPRDRDVASRVAIAGDPRGRFSLSHCSSCSGSADAHGGRCRLRGHRRSFTTASSPCLRLRRRRLSSSPCQYRSPVSRPASSPWPSRSSGQPRIPWIPTLEYGRDGP